MMAKSSPAEKRLHHRFGYVCVLIAAFILLLATSGFADSPSPATWAFNPGIDTFDSDALLDLRSLNESAAGASGFVHVDASGQLVLGDERPARFWAVNTEVGQEYPFVKHPLWAEPPPDLERHARFLAKRGVNLVRFFAMVTPDATQPIDQPKQNEIDWMQRGVAAMKKAGIYSDISPYWSAAAHSGPTWGLDDNGSPQTFGLLFFDEKLQAAYKGWLKKILLSPNPYTGIPLGRDPALAMLQLQDEDSLLFWTFATINGQEKKDLGHLYGNFLAKKYGSVEKAFAAWSDEKLPLDDASAGIADFRNLWELTQPRPATGRQKRLTDQLQFLTDTLYRFDKMMGDYVHHDLGCRVLVNANSWKTVDTTLVDDAERYSYTPNEVIAVNRYFGGIHTGANAGWAVFTGDQFTTPSILTDPREFPVSLKQVRGQPMMITESDWMFPNARGAEGPFLVAAYSSLNGLQAYHWFTTHDEQWSPPESANGYVPCQGVFTFATPDILGTFPAAALMYRKGFLRQGEPAVVEKRALADIYSGASPIIAEAASFDPNRQKGFFARQNNISNGVDPLAFLVGPVQAVYGGDPAQSTVVDLAKYIDTASKTVKSDTGQLIFNYGTGYCTVDSPCAQGATAFFGAHPRFSLSTVDLSSHNEHGSALVVSLDGKPLSSSGKVLVQVCMGCRPSGWKQTPTRLRRTE